ncbi:MAG: SDR family oxidoreductase, partial [Halobacteria archaeon]|nr:SDR family oxidoreductase [Halobacteria archaeon]
ADYLEENEGVIVNFSSESGINPVPGAVAYSVAKGGVETLTRALNEELENTRVNAVAPSVIDTPKNRETWHDADFSQWTDPEDVADVVEFLVSDDGEAVSGETVRLT